MNKPDNTFVMIFSYLATMGVGKNDFKGTASFRGIITQKDYCSLGSVKTRLDQVEEVVTLCVQYESKIDG